MKTNKGFTLVELLVVIAIIALLISILAPSLKVAKEIAKEAVCLTSLRNLGQGVLMYTETNRGWMMPMEVNWSPLLVGFQRPFWCTRLYKMNTFDTGSNATGYNHPHGWIYLWQAGLLTADGPYYCPAQKGDVNGNFDYARGSYPPPWPWLSAAALRGQDPNTQGNVHSSFAYSPYLAYNPPAPSGQIVGAQLYPKRDSYPTDKLLGIDAYLSGDAMAGSNGRLYDTAWSHQISSTVFGFNRLWIGGNVNNIKSPAFLNTYHAAGGDLDSWGDSHALAISYLEK